MINSTIPGDSATQAVRALGKFVLLAAMAFSLPETALAANKTFTGPGNFSTATLWNGNSLPALGDNLTIRGACTFDNAASNLAYGTLTLGGGGAAGTLSWPAGGTNTLNVTAVSAGVAGSAINMTNGGTLQIRTSWSTTNMTFTPGAGTIHWNVTGANSTLPAAIVTYNHLTVTTGTRTASLGAATTVNGNLLISTGTLDVTASNFALNVKGDFTDNATFTARAGTVTLDGTGVQAIGGISMTTFNNLTVNKASGAATVSVNTNIGGNLSISTGTLDLSASNPALNLAGNFSNSGTFTSGTGIFTFNGSAAQSLTGATSFTNLTLDNSSTGLTLNNDVTVTGTLDFTNGKITTGANKVSVGSAGSLTGFSGSKYVVGTLEKGFAGTGAFTFAIGDATDYTPVDLDLTAMSSTGSLAVFQTVGDHPNLATSTLDPNLSVNRYWTFTNAGLAGTYDATFNYVTGDKDTGSNPPDFEIERYSGGVWFTTTEGTRLGTSTQAVGLTDFSAFAIAEPSATPNHYVINHAGTGVNCQPEPVTITAHRSNHNVLTTLTGTITLEAFKDGTGTMRGDWTLNTGSGTFTPGTADSGTATYSFVAADNGQAIFNLRYTYAETVNINVIQGAVTENSGTANNGSEPAFTDPTLEFKNSGFRVTDGVNAALTIGTQIAGKESDISPGSQSIALQAIRTDTSTFACVGVFADNTVVNVDMAFECNNPTACVAGEDVDITNNATTTSIAGNGNGSVTAYTSVPLKFTGTMSEASFTFNYSDAGQIRLHSRRDIPLEDGSASGNLMTGSSNMFVVRPFGFLVAATGNPAAADQNGVVFTQAGEDFEVEVTAVAWQPADDANNDGIPDGHEDGDTDTGNNADLSGNAAVPNFGQETVGEDVSLSARIEQPAGGNDPGLAGGTIVSSFSAGAGSTATARYPEVGIVELKALVDDGDYLGIGAETDKIRGVFGNVGRFTPYDFNVTSNVPQFAPGCASDTTPFTYMDQPFDYATAPSVTITARNKQGATTGNYDGVWWKLADLTGPDAESYNHDGDPLGGGVTLDDAAAGHTPIDCSAGTCDGAFTITFNGPFTYARAATEFGPLASLIDISFSIEDGDNVAYAANPFLIDDTSFTGGNNQQRWGRLVVGNQAGSELLPLNVPLTTEYFDGASYVQNADDDCSAFTLATHVSVSNVDSGTQAGDQPMTINAGSTTITSGDPVVVDGSHLFSFSAPGAGNTGFVDIELDLVTANTPWLMWDSNGDGTVDTSATTEDLPVGRASFGILSLPKALIFQYQRSPWD